MQIRIQVLILELFSLSYAHLKVSNLNCFNDYQTTMVCEFTSDKNFNCSGYSIDFASPDQKHFNCTFMESLQNSDVFTVCECTVKMPEMVNTEKYQRRLWEEGRVINSTIITALDNIKPRAPKILSVKPTKDGNYKVKCKIDYSEDNGLFDSLDTELSYRKKDSSDWNSVNATLNSEILGSQLEPGYVYVVKARSRSTSYNTRYSDWSQEEQWTVPLSGLDPSIFIVSTLCVLLVISICAFYWFCARLKTKWWDTIPSPVNDLKYMLPGNAKVFTPKNYDPSSNLYDVLTVESTIQKPRVPLIAECDRDDPYKSVTSTGSSFDDRRRSLLESADSVGSSGYRNVLLPEESAPPSQETSSQEQRKEDPNSPDHLSVSTCISYRILRNDGKATETPSVLEHLHKNLEALNLFRKGPDTPTDCEYQVCNAVVASAPPAEDAGLSTSLKAGVLDALLSPTSTDACRVDDGYESHGDATAREQARYPACILSPCEDGYQALQTLAEKTADCPCGEDKVDREAHSIDGPEKCPGKEWERELSQCPKWGIPTTCASQMLQNSSLKSPPSSALPTLPSIQTFTDISYHRV
ncbi:hypothetical protein AGOR_G00229460 [Albula goreensis]|uniref:Interleukin-4 receptor alpha N-terminal domain-containing protein n=1 Tax=Albula goreensis TaxID=1534307 RepID=A0A8T3CNE6_9TELE|nr:hypothetical protein AGOR_G00229460 [Albula goreensis]